MPSLEKMEPIPRWPRCELHVFYVLDTSSSMYGTAIAQLNRIMMESIEALKKWAEGYNDNNIYALLKIAVLEFNSNCKWITPNGPETLEDFESQDLEVSLESSEIGEALRELDSKLSRNAFLKSMISSLMPVIIFMTDGNFTDDYEKTLDEIRQNTRFKYATKIAIAVGENPDCEMISEIVRNPVRRNIIDEVISEINNDRSNSRNDKEVIVIRGNDIIPNIDIIREIIRIIIWEIDRGVALEFRLSPFDEIHPSSDLNDYYNRIGGVIRYEAKTHLPDEEYNKEPEAINIDSIDDDWDEEG